MSRLELRTVPAEMISSAIDRETAVVTLTHVDYRSAAIHDMAAINDAAHAAGALTVWDLSHSAGAIELELDGSACDLAVGCGYKYLNGGPGAPAFIYVAERLQDELPNPIQGWMGHADPFAFVDDYRPAKGILRFLTGTPSILAMAALDAGIGTFDGISMTRPGGEVAQAVARCSSTRSRRVAEAKSGSPPRATRRSAAATSSSPTSRAMRSCRR